MIEVSPEKLQQICGELQILVHELEAACSSVENISRQLMDTEGKSQAINTLCYGLRQTQKEVEYQRHSMQDMVSMLEMAADMYGSCENKVCMLAEEETPSYNISLKCGMVKLRAAAEFLEKWNLRLYWR